MMLRIRKASGQLKVSTSSGTNNSSISEETKESQNMASVTIDDETCSSCEEEKTSKGNEILNSLNKIWETVPSTS
jgi:hypothetical protein